MYGLFDTATTWSTTELMTDDTSSWILHLDEKDFTNKKRRKRSLYDERMQDEEKMSRGTFYF
jgi:hypothetical protein